MLVDLETARAAVAARAGKPLFVLDLAVPRDVDARVGDLEGVDLADIDRLGTVVSPGDEGEVEKAAAIVAEEAARFADWRRSAALGPVIRALHDRGERVRAAELARAARRLEDLSDGEREAVEAATKAIVAKLLHDPVVKTKRGDVTAETLAALFGIEPED